MSGVDDALGGSLLGLRPKSDRRGGATSPVTRGRAGSPADGDDVEIQVEDWVNTSSPRGPL
jgi:hypothetical protein